MRLKGIWILCAIALGGLALATAGCGGGGGSSTTTTEETAAIETTETTTTESETTTTETEMTETEVTETDTETEASGTDTTGTAGSSFASSENCQEFVQFASAVATALSGTGDTDLQAAADALQKYADEAPEEIQDDFQVLADAYSKLAEAFEGVDMSSTEAPSPEVLARISKVSSEIDTAKLTAASANISAWTTENCTGG